jgi:hypothetical protein
VDDHVADNDDAHSDINDDRASYRASSRGGSLGPRSTIGSTLRGTAVYSLSVLQAVMCLRLLLRTHKRTTVCIDQWQVIQEILATLLWACRCASQNKLLFTCMTVFHVYGAHTDFVRNIHADVIRTTYVSRYC